MDKLLLTPEEAAEVLSIVRTRLFELLREGVIESARIGASRRVPVAALHTYLRCLSEVSGR